MIIYAPVVDYVISGIKGEVVFLMKNEDVHHRLHFSAGLGVFGLSVVVSNLLANRFCGAKFYTKRLMTIGIFGIFTLIAATIFYKFKLEFIDADSQLSEPSNWLLSAIPTHHIGYIASFLVLCLGAILAFIPKPNLENNSCHTTSYKAL